MKRAVLVMGPTGSGKVTFCATLQKHAATIKKTIYFINFDPDLPLEEDLGFAPFIDIRKLVTTDGAIRNDRIHDADITKALHYSLKCYLAGMIHWFHGEFVNETFMKSWSPWDTSGVLVVFNMPGQVSFFTGKAGIIRGEEILHLGKEVASNLEMSDFQVCCVYLTDARQIVDAGGVFAATMTSLSLMTPTIQYPQVNILTKMNLLSENAKKQLDRHLESDSMGLLEDAVTGSWGKGHSRLSRAIGSLIDSFSHLRFIRFNEDDEECIANILEVIENAFKDFDYQTMDVDYSDEDMDEEESD